MRMRVIEGLSEIAGQFDAFLVDQYGVLHDGGKVFPEAAACLTALRDAGKPVIVVTNSGKREEANVARLTRLGLPRGAFTDLVSSGEIVWQMLRDPPDDFFRSLGTRCYHIARLSDRGFFDGLAVERVERIDEASFILLSSVDQIDDHTAFAAMLKEAARLRLPMVCSNPDTQSVVPGADPVQGPGAVALAYRQLGSAVRLVGKPHRELFDAARRRSGPVSASRILMIGDSLAHDIAGGEKIGCSTLLVLSGIHGGEIAHLERPIIDAELLTLCRDNGANPRYVMTRLRP
jgi:HAD superfamily hydrolase (TIGR01459 family)